MTRAAKPSSVKRVRVLVLDGTIITPEGARGPGDEALLDPVEAELMARAGWVSRDLGAQPPRRRRP